MICSPKFGERKRGAESFERFSLKKGSSFVQQLRPLYSLTPGRYVGVAEVAPSLLQVSEQVGEQVSSILKICDLPKAKKEILEHLNLSNAYLNYKRKIYPLVKKKLLKLTIPDKPQSSKQKSQFSKVKK